MMFLVGGVGVMIALIAVIAKAFLNIEKDDTILREGYEELKLEKIKNKKEKAIMISPS